MQALALSPDDASLDALVDSCERETQRYRRGLASDTRYCLEIFRRALRAAEALHAANVPADHAETRAWDVLVRLYTPFVHAQLNRRAVTWCAAEDVSQQVWLRLYRAARSGLEFPSLEQCLAYLKRTTVSALIELARQEARRSRDQPLPALGDDDAEERLPTATLGPFDIQVRREVFARCREQIADDVEWRIFMLRYGLGYPPRDIAKRFVAEGVQVKGRPATPRRVSDVLERCIRRLADDPQIRDLLSND